MANPKQIGIALRYDHDGSVHFISYYLQSYSGNKLGCLFPLSWLALILWRPMESLPQLFGFGRERVAA